MASTPEDALQWVSAFADQQCYVNLLPHPLGSSRKQETELATNTFPPESYIRCKTPPKMLVILNPRSGRGRSSKVFYSMAEPIFKVNYSCILYKFSFKFSMQSLVDRIEEMHFRLVINLT